MLHLTPARTARWVAATLAGLTVVAALPGAAIAATPSERLAPGVTLEEFTHTTPRGDVHGYLVEADLRNPLVSVDLLTAGSVAARAPISAQADGRHAIAAINGDFFNISNTQPGVVATGASVGPAVGGGRQLKSAVPDKQRFGPGLPPGTSTQDVLGVGYDRIGRLSKIGFEGKAFTVHGGGFTINGFNQYALPENGVGVFDSKWGTTSRKRSTCGTDTVREAACSLDTYEVTVRHGKVVQTATEPGEGAIDRDTVVLVGRETGAATLRALKPGDRVRVDYDLAPATFIPFKFAIGGFPILRDNQPLAGLDAKTAAVRTAAGVSKDGRHLYLLALDGKSTGLTIADLATTMRDFGAANAVNLDGGGSTTLVSRKLPAKAVTVNNHPSGGAERPVPNGIGIFSLLG